MKDLFTVGRAIGMLQSGKSIHFVSEFLHVSRRTVSRWYRQFLAEENFVRKKASGRPKKTTPRGDRLLRRIASNNRRASSTLLVRLWGENVSRWTLKRRLGSFGLRQYRCPLKPFLSPENRQMRYRWAQNHVFWRLERFQEVIWSDESRFRLFSNDGRIRVWRFRGERYRNDLVNMTAQTGGGSVHVWGAIWHGGRSILQVLYQSVNGERYVEVLTAFLNNDNRLPRRWIFQQDNAPAHRCALVRDFLVDHQVRHLPWPSKSPDLNPIEHVWDYIGRRVAAQSPENLRHLTQLILAEWENMPQEFVDNLISSVPRRIRAVIEAHGGSTRY